MQGLNGDGPEVGEHIIGQKPKTTVLRPMDASVVRTPDGTTIVEFTLSPFEAVTLMLPDSSRKALVQALTGGIVLGGGPDLPPGLANGL